MTLNWIFATCAKVWLNIFAKKSTRHFATACTKNQLDILLSKNRPDILVELVQKSTRYFVAENIESVFSWKSTYQKYALFWNKRCTIAERMRYPRHAGPSSSGVVSRGPQLWNFVDVMLESLDSWLDSKISELILVIPIYQIRARVWHVILEK